MISTGRVFKTVGRLLNASFFYSFSMLMFMMTLPVYVDSICSSTSTASLLYGIITAANLFFQFLFLPALGCGADRFGRKRFLLIACVSLFGWCALTSLAMNEATLFFIVIGAVLQGSLGSFYPAAQSMVADKSEEKDRPKFYAIFQIFGNGIGMSGGLVAAVLVGNGFPVRTPILLAALILVFVFIFIALWLRESLLKVNQKPFSWKRANPVGTLKLFMHTTLIAGTITFFCIVMFASASFNAVLWFYMKERYHATMMQYVLGAVLFATMGFIATIISSPLSAKIGERKVMSVSFFIGSMTMMLAALAPWVWLFLVAAFLSGLIMMALPAMWSMLSKNVIGQRMAEVQSGFQSFAFFSQMCGSFFFAGVFALSTSDEMHPKMPELTFIIASIAFLIAAVFAHVYFKKYPTDEFRVTLDSDEQFLPKDVDEEEEEGETDTLLPNIQSRETGEDAMDSVDLESIVKSQSESVIE